MTETPQQTPANRELTLSERRMLRLLSMLPSPDRRQGDDLDVRAARAFWNTMSEHLGTVRGSEDQILTPSAHAGALIEEGLIQIRSEISADLEPTDTPPEGIDPAFTLRAKTRWMARRVFDIFGELSDRQFVALGNALSPSWARTPSGLAHEWLRQLRETALNVIVENRPIEWDAENEFDFLDKAWGRPRHDERFFPIDLDGVLKKYS